MEDIKKTVRHRGANSARVISVIEIKACVGKGTAEDLLRIVTEYWSLEGVRLATVDPEIPDSLPYSLT